MIILLLPMVPIGLMTRSLKVARFLGRVVGRVVVWAAGVGGVSMVLVLVSVSVLVVRMLLT